MHMAAHDPWLMTGSMAQRAVGDGYHSLGTSGKLLTFPALL